MSDYIVLDATSAFREQNIVAANISGYIKEVMIVPGQEVRQGELLFVLETKEAKALNGRVVDTSLHFNGIIKIRAAKNGYVSLLSHQQGDFVTESTTLCTIANRNSFVFELQVPFALTHFVTVGAHCEIILPDSQNLIGTIASKSSTVNPVTQTQQFVVKTDSQYNLPENLIAQVKITKSSVKEAMVLPKSVLLTDVQQTQWWVMKMMNDSTAVKVGVAIGITNDSLVQILSPKFFLRDRILASGNYGLPDTAYIKVEK
jgi:multidrug efflux pump subunit AcrA (membrane-fusion protein)